MDELTEARRAALRRFVAAEGGYAVVRQKYALSASHASYLSQQITPGSKAPFGEKSAKSWQERLRMAGDPLLYPVMDFERAELAPVSLEATVARLGEFLKAVPSDQREVIASVLNAYARRPVHEVGVALITLLNSMQE